MDNTQIMVKTFKLRQRVATFSGEILQTSRIKVDPKIPFKTPTRKFRLISMVSNVFSIHFNILASHLTQLAANSKESRPIPIAPTSRTIMLVTKTKEARTCREMATVRSITSSANL